MAMSKEQRRKIYGIREPKEPGDPEVMARRYFHEAMARWELKWLTSISFLSAITAVALILAPAIIKPWGELIAQLTPISCIRSIFTTPNGWLFLIIIFGAICHIYTSSKIDGENFSHHAYPINLSGVRSAQQVIDMELYPATKVEERVYFFDFVGGVWISLFFWPGMLGGFVMILNSMEK